MGKLGLRYEQDHNARADAHDLKRLLACKHQGHTYLKRLLSIGKQRAACGLPSLNPINDV
jgi:hypothetical protein